MQLIAKGRWMKRDKRWSTVIALRRPTDPDRSLPPETSGNRRKPTPSDERR